MDKREAHDWSLEGRMAATVWNQVFMGLLNEKTLEGEAEIPMDDALQAPVPKSGSESAPESNLGCFSGAQAVMVSEFMLAPSV